MKFVITGTNLYLAILPLVLLPLVRKLFSSNFFDAFALIFVAQSVIMLAEVGLTNVLVKLIGDVRKNVRGAHYLYTFTLFVLIYILSICVILVVIRFTILPNFLVIQNHYKDFIILLIFIGCSRFVASIPRIVLYGYDIILSTSTCIIIISSLRYLLPIVLLWLNVVTEDRFFVVYLYLSLIEVFCLFCILLLNNETKHIFKTKQNYLSDLRDLMRTYWKVALFTALPSFMWIVTQQADKAFQLTSEGISGSGMIVSISGLASGILLLVNSINAAYIPKLVALETLSKTQISLLKNLVIVLGFIVTVFFVTTVTTASEILAFWFNDSQISNKYSELLVLYTIYFSILSLGTFFYIYFFLTDLLRYHLLVNVLHTLGVCGIFFMATSITEYMRLLCLNAAICFSISFALYFGSRSKYHTSEVTKHEI